MRDAHSAAHDKELVALSRQLEVPPELEGFGNYLVWMVATRAAELVDAVYDSGVARPSPEYRMLDGHHLPTQALFGWLIVANEHGGGDPARLPRGDAAIARAQRSQAAVMTPAMGLEPQRFRTKWLRDIAARCLLEEAELRFLECARSVFGVKLNPAALRKSVAATRAAGLPANRRSSGALAARTGAASVGLAADPATGQLVIGKVPSEPLVFVARDLADALAVAAATGRVAVVCALTGLRGVGKTQLAAAYARQRIGDGWGLVAWVDAESRQSLVAGLATVAGRLGVADPRGDSEESAGLLRDHLQSRAADGLLVLDNAVSPQDVAPFLPASGGTQIIITSTNQAFTWLGVPVDVPSFSREESVRYLRERTGQADPAGAAEVAAELGDLPLALAQAATVIYLQRLSYPRYLERLRTVQIGDVLRVVPGEYAAGVPAALLDSVRTAEAAGADEDGEPSETDRMVGRLLRALALLSPAGVQRDLLAGLAGDDARPQAVDQAAERCVAWSLLTWSMSGEELIMHRLLGKTLRERDLAEGRWPQTVGAVASLLAERLFAADEAWPRRAEGRSLVAHIEASWQAAAGTAEARAAAGGDLLARLLRLRLWTVRQLAEAADLSGAIEAGQRLCDDCLRYHAGDRVTLGARENFAVARMYAGQTAEAIVSFESILADRRRLFGDDDPDTLETLDDLGAAHNAAARYEEAAVLFERALRGRERTLAPDHRAVYESRVNLAAAKSRIGQVAEAIELDEQTLAERTATVGPDHADTLLVRANLAFKYRLAGRLDEATGMHEETYEAWKRLHGPEHRMTFNAATNLGACYADAGRLPEAAQLHQDTLDARLRVLGPDHPDTLVSRYALGVTYLAMEQYADAAELLDRSLAERLRLLGPDSPEALLSRHALAATYTAVGRYREAIALHEENLAASLRVHGPDHRHTRNTIDALDKARAALPPAGESPESA